MGSIKATAVVFFSFIIKKIIKSSLVSCCFKHRNLETTMNAFHFRSGAGTRVFCLLTSRGRHHKVITETSRLRGLSNVHLVPWDF